MTTYKIINDPVHGTPMQVSRDDGWQIPMNAANTDYQAFLKWLEEGNTPEPADELTGAQP